MKLNSIDTQGYIRFTDDTKDHDTRNGELQFNNGIIEIGSPLNVNNDKCRWNKI